MRIWPSPDEYAGLIEEASNTSADDKWEKGEEYFLRLQD